jgi:hypothetical protein
MMNARRSDVKQMAAPCLLALFSFVLFSARAEEVGRTKFELPGAQWTLLTAFDRKSRIKGESSRPIRNKVFYLADADGTIRALLRIASQDVSYTTVRWPSNCPAPKPGYFTRDFGSDRNGETFECAIVSARFSPFSYFQPDSQIGKAIAERQLKLFSSGYSLRSTYGSDKGAYLMVELVTRADFKGLADVRPSTAQTHEVPAELIAWTESLQKSVTSSVGSFQGGLTLPPIEFKQ